MFTKKQALDAIQKIIDNLINPVLKDGSVYRIGHHPTCPLCKIYFNSIETRCCIGCPFAFKSGEIGCIHLQGYKFLYRAARTDMLDIDLQTIYLKHSIKMRKVKEYLRKLPAKRFSPKDWKYINWTEVSKEMGEK